MVDLSKPEEVERWRRSIVMLPPQAMAMTREEAMAVLAELQRRMADPGRPGSSADADGRR